VYFSNINLLRAFAALSVLVYHVIEHLHWETFPVEGGLLWFRIGWMGVDIFFVISGFVISLSAIKLYQKNPAQFSRTYIRHRLARILPLYLLTIFIYIVFVQPNLVFQADFVKNFLYHLFFIHNMDINTHGAINGVNWTVAREVQFYLFILLFIKWIAYSHILKILCILTGIAWAYKALLLYLFDFNSYELFVYSTQFIGCLDEFAFGIVLAKIVISVFFNQDSLKSVSWMKNHMLGWVWFFLAIVFVWISVGLVYWSNASYWDKPLMVIFWRSLAGFSVMCVVASSVWIRFPKMIEKKVLLPFFYLGEISYGIYLWHLLVIERLKQSTTMEPVVFFIYTLVVVLILAALSWEFIEKPIIKFFRKR
jgi:peptidoglycan/LPS O-acetylase OafA/YrhL